MTSVDGQKDKHRFLVGTCSAKEANELHLIEFDDDRNEVNCCAVLPHTDEVWSLATHPTDPALFFSIHYHDRAYRATLWQIPTDEDSSGGGVLDELPSLLELPVGEDVVVRSIVFNPMDVEGGNNSPPISRQRRPEALLTRTPVHRLLHLAHAHLCYQ